MRADVDEVAASTQVARQQPQLILVVEPEVEVALQRLPQVEPEAYAARETHDRTAFVGHPNASPQAPFAAEIDPAEGDCARPDGQRRRARPILDLRLDRQQRGHMLEIGQ